MDDKRTDHVGLGCALILVLNIAAVVVLGRLFPRPPVSPFLILALFQILVGASVGLWLRRTGYTATLQGLIMGAGLALLFSGLCFAGEVSQPVPQAPPRSPVPPRSSVRLLIDADVHDVQSSVSARG